MHPPKCFFLQNVISVRIQIIHNIDFGINPISCFGNVRNLAHVLKYYVLKHFLVNATGMFHIDNYIEKCFGICSPMYGFPYRYFDYIVSGLGAWQTALKLAQISVVKYGVLLKIVFRSDLISVALALKGAQERDTLWLTPCATSECGGCRVSVYDVCTVTDALGCLRGLTILLYYSLPCILHCYGLSICYIVSGENINGTRQWCVCQQEQAVRGNERTMSS
jgi:hypothetical protein